MPSHNCRRRTSVYLVDLPAEFQPGEPWDMPPKILNGELHRGNLSHEAALQLARSHNAAAVDRIQRGEPIGPWAIVVRDQRPREHACRQQHSLTAKAEAIGGAS